MKETFRIQELESEVRAYHLKASMLVNLIDQIEIALEAEDDPDEALRLIKESKQ